MARYSGEDDYDDEYDPDDPCTFCGSQDCDKTGYNCPDEYYDRYNEGEGNYLDRDANAVQ